MINFPIIVMVSIKLIQNFEIFTDWPYRGPCALVWPVKYHQLFEFPSQFSHLFWSSHQLFVTLTCHLKIKSESKQFEIAFINLAKLGDGVDES